MALELNVWVDAQVLVLGLVAGMLGGLLGVGGSTILIPGLTLIFGYNQHLYQAAAMIANVVVCVPAARRHYRSGLMTPSILRPMMAAATVAVLAGVWLSNRAVFRGADGGLWLGRLLAVFLVYVIVLNVRRLIAPRWQGSPDAGTVPAQAAVPASWPPSSGAGAGVPKRPVGPAALVGGGMGLIAGMLGIGGGAVAVPLQQIILKAPLRVCIANSSAVICLSATMGAVYKNVSLWQHGRDWQDSLVLALLLAPSCWLGGHLGAGLTHRLPVRQVRVVFVALMIAAAIKMAAVF